MVKINLSFIPENLRLIPVIYDILNHEVASHTLHPGGNQHHLFGSSCDDYMDLFSVPEENAILIVKRVFGDISRVSCLRLMSDQKNLYLTHQSLKREHDVYSYEKHAMIVRCCSLGKLGQVEEYHYEKGEYQCTNFASLLGQDDLYLGVLQFSRLQELGALQPLRRQEAMASYDELEHMFTITSLTDGMEIFVRGEHIDLNQVRDVAKQHETIYEEDTKVYQKETC